jgi:hypothetical protein
MSALPQLHFLVYQYVLRCCVHSVYRSFIAAAAANDPELAALLAKNAALMQETEQQQQQQEQEIQALPTGRIAESAEGGFYTAAGPHNFVVHIAAAGSVAATAASTQVSTAYHATLLARFVGSRLHIQPPVWQAAGVRRLSQPPLAKQCNGRHKQSCGITLPIPAAMCVCCYSCAAKIPTSVTSYS